MRRAEQRDDIRYTAAQWRLHHRAAALFDLLAADDPDRIRVLDRRRVNDDHAVEWMCNWITHHRGAATPRVELGSPAEPASDGIE